MITRSKAKSLSHTSLSATRKNTVSSEPESLKDALSTLHWVAAMKEELQALHENETWILVPRATTMNVVGSKWVFKTKMKSHDSTAIHNL